MSAKQRALQWLPAKGKIMLLKTKLPQSKHQVSKSGWIWYAKELNFNLLKKLFYLISPLCKTCHSLLNRSPALRDGSMVVIKCAILFKSRRDDTYISGIWLIKLGGLRVYIFVNKTRCHTSENMFRSYGTQFSSSINFLPYYRPAGRDSGMAWRMGLVDIKFINAVQIMGILITYMLHGTKVLLTTKNLPRQTPVWFIERTWCI